MPLWLSIVTPERAVLETGAHSLVAPGAEGEFGVLPEHESFLAALRPGVVRYQDAESSGRVAVSSGFAEVTADRVTLLVQSAEQSFEIDRDRAEAARERAQEALRYSGPDTPSAEVERLREDLARARARVSASADRRSTQDAVLARSPPP